MSSFGRSAAPALSPHIRATSRGHTEVPLLLSSDQGKCLAVYTGWQLLNTILYVVNTKALEAEGVWDDGGSEAGAQQHGLSGNSILSERHRGQTHCR